MSLLVKSWCGRILRFVLAILGVFPVSNPMSKVSDLRFRPISVYTVLLLVLHILVPSIIFIDMVASNSAEVLSGSSRLSRKLIFYSLVPLYCAPNLVLRLSGLIQCQRMIELLKRSSELRDALTVAGFIPTRLSKGKKILVCTNAVLGILILGKFALYQLPGWAQVKFLNYNYTLLPEVAPVRLLIIAVPHIIIYICLTLSISLVILGGISLVDIQHGFFSLLLQSHIIHLTPTDYHVGLAGVSGCNSAHEFLNVLGLGVNNHANLSSVFTTVKELFESYQSIAGWHLLGLTFIGTLLIIKGFSGIIVDPSTWLASTLVSLKGVGIISLISCFGNYFEQSILSNQRKIEALPDHRQNEHIIKRCLRWKVQLTARNFFAINPPLVLHVMATVATYFIFMFQLKLSEDSITYGQSCSCNNNTESFVG